MIFGKQKTPEQQMALAQALQQQAQTPIQGQMVGGRYISPGVAGGLAQLGKAYLGGKLQDVANQQQQEQSSALTQALMGGPEGLQERLAELNSPMAQETAQKLALEEAMRVQPQIVQGETLGLPKGTMLQQTGDGYEVLYKPESEKLPAGIIRDPVTGQRIIDPLYKQMKTDIAAAGRPNIRVGGGTTYEMGSIPQGFMAQYDELGRPLKMIPVPGGPADLERIEKEKKQEAQQAKTKETATLLSEEINRAKNILKESPYLTTGFFGNILKDWAGSSAADFKQLAETIGANIGFDYLNQMRQNSPTGAALGSVTERELSLLRSTAGSIEQSQSPAQLMENLDRLEKQFLEVVHGKDAAEQMLAKPENQDFSITAPNGKTYTFPNAEALQKFKERAGL